MKPLLFQLTADEPQLQISTIKTKYLASPHFADIVNVYAELTAPKTCDIRLSQALIGVDFSICLISNESLSKTGRI